MSTDVTNLNVKSKDRSEFYQILYQYEELFGFNQVWDIPNGSIYNRMKSVESLAHERGIMDDNDAWMSSRLMLVVPGGVRPQFEGYSASYYNRKKTDPKNTETLWSVLLKEAWLMSDDIAHVTRVHLKSKQRYGEDIESFRARYEKTRTSSFLMSFDEHGHMEDFAARLIPELREYVYSRYLVNIEQIMSAILLFEMEHGVLQHPTRSAYKYSNNSYGSNYDNTPRSSRSSHQGYRKSNVTCYYCHKRGHKEYQCYQKKAMESRVTEV